MSTAFAPTADGLQKALNGWQKRAGASAGGHDRGEAVVVRRVREAVRQVVRERGGALLPPRRLRRDAGPVGSRAEGTARRRSAEPR